MKETSRVREAVVGRAREEADAYRGDQPRPLGGYLVVLGVYTALVAATAAVAAATGRRLPDRWRVQDLMLLTLGTHKLSRTVAKDAVTSPLRAPVARYAETGGPAEVNEDARHDTSLRHSLGELLTCPFCLDMWAATAFVGGLLFAPRLTRLVAGGFSAVAGADFLHLAYARAQHLAQQAPD